MLRHLRCSNFLSAGEGVQNNSLKARCCNCDSARYAKRCLLPRLARESVWTSLLSLSRHRLYGRLLLYKSTRIPNITVDPWCIRKRRSAVLGRYGSKEQRLTAHTGEIDGCSVPKARESHETAANGVQILNLINQAVFVGPSSSQQTALLPKLYLGRLRGRELSGTYVVWTQQ